MKPADIHLDFPSVGATENIMMASVNLKGRTRIFNAAREPEIVDLQNFLNKMGAKISGAGDGVIVVEGVQNFARFVEYMPISDRIIAGTYLIGGLISGGNVEICNINPEHIYSLISKLKNSACNLTIKNDRILLNVNSRVSAMNVETNPYPGFPTDLQPQLISLLSLAQGTSLVTENLFETRFKHIPELVKMGAKITVKNKLAIITGVENLSGAEVCATDLRAGAALVLAGLNAKGYTIVDNVEHIARGYENLADELNSLGANIQLLD
ncbi:MAG: UDP-N-acetylglucosamine 1-carboxyvinyltransferase, partial [Christensenellales bacterium]